MHSYTLHLRTIDRGLTYPRGVLRVGIGCVRGALTVRQPASEWLPMHKKTG